MPGHGGGEIDGGTGEDTLSYRDLQSLVNQYEGLPLPLMIDTNVDGTGWAHSYHANGDIDQWKNIEIIEIYDLRTIITGSDTGSLTFTDGGYERWDAANDNAAQKMQQKRAA